MEQSMLLIFKYISNLTFRMLQKKDDLQREKKQHQSTVILELTT